MRKPDDKDPKGRDSSGVEQPPVLTAEDEKILDRIWADQSKKKRPKE